MRRTKFVPNEKDAIHCLQACLRMAYETQTGMALTSIDADKITGFKEGLHTWPFRMMHTMAEMGFEVIDVTLFDYEGFANDTKAWTEKRYGSSDRWEYFQKISDMKQAAQDANACIQNTNIKLANRIATLDDIKLLNQDGFTTICGLNYYDLVQRDGYSGHFVVVENVEVASVTIQDPGPPAQPDWQVPIVRFMNAWTNPDDERPNIIAFRYNKQARSRGESTPTL